jgi:hypothetical protein
MAKQIIVTMNTRIGRSSDSDSILLERISKRVFDAVGSHAATGTFSSPCGGAKAIVDDGDVSQDAANAVAQGIKDVVGAGRTYKASEISALGVITELVAPVPV